MSKLIHQLLPSTIVYQESFIPPRCRKVRVEEKTEVVDLMYRVVEPSELQKAFYVKTFDSETMIYAFEGKLYTRCTIPVWDPITESWPQQEPSIAEFEDWARKQEYHYRYCCRGEKDRVGVLKYAQEMAGNYLFVEDRVFVTTGEPVYVAQTFGLRGDGTGLSVEYLTEYCADPDRYFNALEGEAAVAYTNEIAERHGDKTGIYSQMIEVYLPEMVRQPAHTGFLEMSVDDFMHYIQENFTVSGEALRLIRNIAEYANRALYGSECVAFLKEMLNNTIGIEDSFLHRVRFTN